MVCLPIENGKLGPHEIATKHQRLTFNAHDISLKAVFSRDFCVE